MMCSAVWLSRRGLLCYWGQIVLEALDLVVDCGRQRLIPNPEAPDGMMLYEDY